jgi:hypothetical protein
MEKHVFHLEVRISAHFTEVADNLDILHFLKLKIHSFSKNWSPSIVYHETWSSDFLISFPCDDGDRSKLAKAVFFFWRI